MFTCPECGKPIDHGALSCPHCGYPINQNASSSSMVKPPKKKKVIVIAVLIAAVLFGILYNTFSNSIMPYNVQWGESFEEVQKHHKNAADLVRTDSGNSVSRNDIDSSFFGLNNDDVNTLLVYDFKKSDSLSQIVIACSLTSESKMSGKAVTDKIIKFYTRKCKHKPDEQSEYEWEWASKTEKISLAYWSDELIAVTLTPTN